MQVKIAIDIDLAPYIRVPMGTYPAHTNEPQPGYFIRISKKTRKFSACTARARRPTRLDNKSSDLPLAEVQYGY